MFDRLKALLNDNERFRPEFEHGLPPSADLERVGPDYADPEIQEKWLEWTHDERLKESVW